MPKRVFVSYSHRQSDSVLDRLVACLKAGGAEVLIDRERFDAGKALTGQMDGVQDAADAVVLVLSPEHLASDACRHEMERAVEPDSRFEDGLLVPVMHRKCSLPDLLKGANPL